MRKQKLRTLAKLVIFAISASLFSCKPGEPNINERIFDEANLLTPAEENELFQPMKSLETELGPQLAIMTVDSLNGASIEEFSLAQAKKLHLGREKIDDGVLIVVALKNKKMRIEVGSGLEKIIDDAVASRIINEGMAPNFKNNEYGVGLLTAVDEIRKAIVNQEELIGQHY